jgi:hypothetical protein
MLIFAELILLALWCLGLRIATGSGMILEHPHDWAETHLPSWLYKPVIGCIFCMASVHGIIIHAGACLLFGADPFLLPLVIVCGVSLNGFIHYLFELLESYGVDESVPYVQLPVFFHSDNTKVLHDLDLEYDDKDLEVREMTFVSVGALEPWQTDAGETQTLIHANGSTYRCPLNPETVQIHIRNLRA